MAMQDVVRKVQDLLEELAQSAEADGAKMIRTNNVSAAKRLRAALLEASKECKEIRKLIMEEIKDTQSGRADKRAGN